MLRNLAAAITAAFASGLAERGIDAKPAAIYAQVVIGLAVHIGRWWLLHPEFTLEDLSTSTAEFLWNGFGHLAEPRPRAPAARA
jgi:hypothetical protein